MQHTTRDRQFQKPQLQASASVEIDASSLSSVDSSSHSPVASSPLIHWALSAKEVPDWCLRIHQHLVQTFQLNNNKRGSEETCGTSGAGLDLMGEAFEKEKDKAFEKELEQTTGIRVFKRPRQQDSSSIEERALPPRKKLAAHVQQRVGYPSEAEEQPTGQEMPLVSEAAEASSDRCIRSSDNTSTQSAAPSCELDIVWPKLLALKEKHLNEMRELFALLEIRRTMPISPGQLRKLMQYKEVLYRIIPYLTVPKEKIPKEFNQEKAQLLENEIVRIVNTFQRRRQVNLFFRQQLEGVQPADLRFPCQIQQRQQDHLKPTQQIQLSENGMFILPNCSSPQQSS